MKLPPLDQQWKCYPTTLRAVLWYAVYVVLICNRWHRVYPPVAFVSVFVASYLWNAARTVIRNSRRKP